MAGFAPHRMVDGIASIQLDRPERANALGPEVVEDLARSLDVCLGSPETRVLVLSGRGRHFCAGGDLDHPLFSEPDAARRHRMIADAYGLTDRLLDAEVPVITAVHGRCAGAALAFVLASDLCLAGASSTFSLDFVRLGLAPDMGVSWLLGRTVPAKHASELALTAEPIDAETAHRWGLVSRVVPDGTHLEEAMGIAAALAAHPADGVAAVRRLVRDNPGRPRTEAFGVEMDVMESLLETPEVQARLESFRTVARQKRS